MSAKTGALRGVYWGGFLLGPVALVLGFMDFASHGSSGPGIGLEGHGPAIGPALVAMSLAFAVGSVVARMLLADNEKPSIGVGVFLGLLVFVGMMLLSGPIFRWKWSRDCEEGVGRGCYAMSQISLDPGRRESLGAKACQLGVASACPSGSADSTPPPASAAAPPGSAVSAAPGSAAAPPPPP